MVRPLAIACPLSSLLTEPRRIFHPPEMLWMVLSLGSPDRLITQLFAGPDADTFIVFLNDFWISPSLGSMNYRMYVRTYVLWGMGSQELADLQNLQKERIVVRVYQ